MFDWNDLKYLLAVARHGSTVAAGKALGVNQSTVQRRMAEFERRIGRPLLVRKPSGYQLTPLAHDLLPFAENVAKAVEALEFRVKSAAPDGRAIIRLTCPEPVVGRLQPLIDKFHERYSRVSVHIVTSDRYLDLLNGDADVAFRSGDTEDALVGFKVADSVWAIYASAEYIKRYGRPAAVAELDRHILVTLDESMSRHRLMVWLTEVAPRAQVASRSNSILGLVQSVKSGIGLAPLPVLVAEEAGLEKVLGPIPALSRTWKLLTHPRLRKTAPISAFFDFVKENRALIRTILS